MWTPPPPLPPKPQELKHYSSYLQLSTTIQHLATPLQLSLSWSYSSESKLTSAPKLAWPIWPILSRAFRTQTGSRYGSNFTGWYISADKWALGSPWLEQYFIHLTLKPGGWTDMKRVGMLVVSLRGVNFGFWSHSGCSGQNAIIFSREGLVWGCTRKI